MTNTPSKKFKLARKRVEFEPFDYRLYIILTDDVAGYAEHRWDYTGGSASALHIVPKGCDESWLIFPFDPTVGNIAHEAWHFVRRMLQSCHAELDNEVVAYHLGYAVNVIYTFVRDTQDKEAKHEGSEKRGWRDARCASRPKRTRRLPHAGAD